MVANEDEFIKIETYKKGNTKKTKDEIIITIKKMPQKIELNEENFKNSVGYLKKFKNTLDYINNPKEDNKKSKNDEPMFNSKEKFESNIFYKYLEEEFNDLYKDEKRFLNFIFKLLLFKYGKEIKEKPKTEIKVSDFFNSIFVEKKIIEEGKDFDIWIENERNKIIKADIIDNYFNANDIKISKINDTIQLEKVLEMFTKSAKVLEFNEVEEKKLKEKYEKIVESNKEKTDDIKKKLNEISTRYEEKHKTLLKGVKDSDFLCEIIKEVNKKIEKLEKLEKLEKYDVEEINKKIKKLLEISKNDHGIISDVYSLLDEHESIINQINERKNLNKLKDIQFQLNKCLIFFTVVESNLFKDIKSKINFSNVEYNTINSSIKKKIKEINEYTKTRQEKNDLYSKKVNEELDKLNKNTHTPNLEVKKMFDELRKIIDDILKSKIIDDIPKSKKTKNNQSFFSALVPGKITKDNSKGNSEEQELKKIKDEIDKRSQDEKISTSYSFCTAVNYSENFETDFKSIYLCSQKSYNLNNDEEKLAKVLKEHFEKAKKLEFIEKEQNNNFSLKLTKPLFDFEYQKKHIFSDQLIIKLYDI